MLALVTSTKLPLILTAVPPPVGPLLGDIQLIVGAYCG